MKKIHDKDIKTSSETMLSNLDKVMRQLRRRPQGSRHAGRGTYRLLKKVSKYPGVSTKELAELMDIRRASLNERLMRLENEGMIKRERDSNDQRVHLIHLEEYGKDYLDHIKEIRAKKNDSINEILTQAEIREFSNLAIKLATGLEQLFLDTESDKNKKEDTNEQ